MSEVKSGPCQSGGGEWGAWEIRGTGGNRGTGTTTLHLDTGVSVASSVTRLAGVNNG